MKKLLVLVVLLAAVLTAVGASTGENPRISVNQFVEHPALNAVLKGFQDELAARNVEAIYSVHNAQANVATANQIAQQIAGEDPDLVLAIATPSAQACAQAVKKSPVLQETPLLFTAITDPKGVGLVDDLARPGGNITGVSDLIPVDKHMAMVREFVPDLKRLGVLYNAGEANNRIVLDLLRKDAARHGYVVVEATAAKSSEVYQAAKSLVGNVDAVFIPTDNTVISGLESAVKVCRENGIPLFAADVDSVERGAIAAMGFDYYEHGRQTGVMALRILEGADPGEIAVETQERLFLYVNPGAARATGIEVPEALLAKADKIVE